MLDPRKFDETKRFFAEYQIVVKGELDAEYKRVAVATAEWDKRQNYAALAAKLVEDQRAHSAAVTQFAQDKAKSFADIQAKQTANDKKTQDLSVKEQSLKQREQDLTEAKVSHEALVASHASSYKAQVDALAKKGEELDALQSTLHDRDVDLSAKTEKVNATLRSINAMSSVR